MGERNTVNVINLGKRVDELESFRFNIDKILNEHLAKHPEYIPVKIPDSFLKQNYWFLKYRWKRVPAKGIPVITYPWEHENVITQLHPVRFFAALVLAEKEETKYEYILDFFYPLSKELYEVYKEWIVHIGEGK